MASNSKLPKLQTSLKSLQIKKLTLPSVPSAASSSSSSITSRSIEAPVFGASASVPVAPRFRRRSKSVTDLRTLGTINKSSKFDMPSIAERKILTKPVAKTTTSSNLSKNINFSKRIQAIKGPTATTTSSTLSKAVTGVKRPFLVSTNSDEGPSKPKVIKKVPAWDLKGQLAIAREQIKDLKQTAQSTEDIRRHFDEISSIKDQLETELNQANAELESLSKEHDKNLKEKLEKTKLCIQQSAELEQLQSNLDLKTKLLNNIQKERDTLKAFADTAQSQLEEYQEKNRNLEEKCTIQQEQLIGLEQERRTLHNTIQDLKGNIRVFCRVRTSLPSEEDKLLCHIEFPDENSLYIRKSRESVNQISGKLTQEVRSEFSFDKVFPPQAEQEEIFQDISQFVQSALDGYNICVFAYGQTGSGKTFTMQGDEERKGMIPRTTNMIFEKIRLMQYSGWEYVVEVSFLEIYNETIRDLLNMDGTRKLQINYNEGRGITVLNLVKRPVTSANELENIINTAQKVRATATTNFNEHSSRSHAVIKIYLLGTHKANKIAYEGSINLIDLAGSESAKPAIRGERLTETKNINKSLATLGNVIGALHTKAKHIPYRDSKLTYLLQSSLSGNSKTMMIVNISPIEDCFTESINSLRFAAKVKEVKIASKRNRILQPIQDKIE